MDRKYRILVSRQDFSGCSCLRLTFPMEAINSLSKRIEMKYAEGTESISEEEISWADAVILQRKVIPYWAKMVRTLRGAGKKIIYEVDDAIVDYHMSKGNPGKAYYDQEVNQDGFKRIVEVVDGFTTTTPSLKETFDKYSSAPARVLPNSLPMNWINKQTLKPPSAIKNFTVINWTSSAFHKQDVSVIAPVFQHLNQKYPNIRFMLSGFADPDLKRVLTPSSIIEVPWVPVPKFYHILRQIPFHLSVAPLHLPCKFNEGKSNLKILDAATHKSFTVASPSVEYMKCHKFAGIVGTNTVDEWISVIEAIIQDKKDMQDLGDKAYHALYKKYNMDKNWRMWEDYYIEVIEG